MTNISVVFARQILGADERPAQVGDTVRLFLATNVPDLPPSILAIVQQPITRARTTDPETGCLVRGYRYALAYDEADLGAVLTVLLPAQVVSATGLSCGDLINEETQARILGDRELVVVTSPARFLFGTSLVLPDLVPFVDLVGGNFLRLTAPLTEITAPVRDCVVQISDAIFSGEYLQPLNAEGGGVSDSWYDSVSEVRLSKRVTVASFSRGSVTFVGTQTGGGVSLSGLFEDESVWVFDFTGTLDDTEYATALADAINAVTLTLGVHASIQGGTTVQIIANVASEAFNSVGVSCTVTDSYEGSPTLLNGIAGGLTRWAVSQAEAVYAYYSDGDAGTPEAGFAGGWTVVSPGLFLPPIIDAIVPPPFSYLPQVILQAVPVGESMSFLVIRSNALTRQFLSYTWKVERASADIWALLPVGSDSVLAAECSSTPDTALVFEHGNALQIIPRCDVFFGTLPPNNGPNVPNATYSLGMSDPPVGTRNYFPVPGSANNLLTEIEYNMDDMSPAMDNVQASFAKLMLYLAGSSVTDNGYSPAVTIFFGTTGQLIAHPLVIRAKSELLAKGWTLGFPAFIGYP